MHKTRWACALLVAAACSSAPAATPTLDEAHHAYYHGQFARSLRMYQELAAGGNAEAAERAGFMLFHGDGYYGRQIRRDTARASALLLQAAKAGRPGAGFMLNMTERTD